MAEIYVFATTFVIIIMYKTMKRTYRIILMCLAWWCGTTLVLKAQEENTIPNTNLSATTESSRVCIRGTVIDDEKNPIELANVRVEGTIFGTVCDLKGRYSFTCESTDSVVVVFSMLGYQTRKRVLQNPTDTVTLNVMLLSNGIELGEVDVTEIRRQTNTMSDVSIKDIRHMGNASGSGVEQMITTQAGVSTHNEMSSQYNVRGGSFDENSVYINGIEVYRPLLIRAGQQEGLSIINPDLVERVSFSAGGFEAKYGEKMSSVLDIQYKKVKGFEGAVAASLLGASAYAGYGTDKFSMLHGVRYKTTSYLLNTLATKGEYKPKDLDYQTYISWSPNKRWTFDLMGVISLNDYNFTPADRNTRFGTSEDVKEFHVYFDGMEKDKFHTFFGAATLTHHFNEQNELSLQFSAFKTQERETFDISGEYWLQNDGENDRLGIGKYLQHARNRMNASVMSVGLVGRSRFTSHDLRYGLLMKRESVNERMREWEMHDSAGYSLPHTGTDLNLDYNLVSRNEINSTRLEAYVQDTWRKEFDEGEMILNYGVRLSHWSWNNEWLFSPRATVAFVPKFNDNLLFRFSTGLYYQAPFYKEIKDTVTVKGNTSVMLNKNIRSQRSVHFVLGGEYKFRVNNRPFKATAELYYKSLSDLIPYNVDNVRVVYYGQNLSSGYAAGLDLKLYGEFVPGTDSWVSVGLMKTEETIGGVRVPRPTDHLLNASVFLSDYFPGTTRWKGFLRGHYAGGLPFGPPHMGRESQFFRMPAYRRLDLGLSYRLLNNEDHHLQTGVGRYLKNVWLGLDAFNILDISNVNSYFWVTDIAQNQYAVPNYLTGRQVNFRVLVEF